METITPLKISSLSQLMYDEFSKKYTLDNRAIEKIKLFGKLSGNSIKNNMTFLTLKDETGEEQLTVMKKYDEERSEVLE